ncbi:hypothetical protein M758_1G294200 [Ceratodon purpureus]|nr:hypothetical protein M758_1G294200 [Ceratodon purpureus]
MADLLRGRNHPAWSASDQVDIHRSSLDSCGGSSASSSDSASSRTTGSLDGYDKSRRSFRHSNNLLLESRQAYPLPHPMQFQKLSVAAPSPSDPTNDVLHSTSMRSTEKEGQKWREEADSAKSHFAQRSTAAMEQQNSSIHATDKQPSPSPRNCLDQARILESTSGYFADNAIRGFLHERDAAVKNAEPSRIVVVVYDGQKKFTTAPLDIAINGYTRSAGDTIVVVAFLEHVLSPMGMRMVADMEQFSGVNDAVLKQAVTLKKMEIESKLRETSRRQLCQMKKIHLDVKILPGSNSKVLVAKEILALQATSVIFDKNTMKNRKYYEENLSCHVLRLRSDGHRVETVCLFGQRLEKAGSITSHYSDSSASSVGSEPACNSPSIWSKLNIFVSKSSTGQLRHCHGGHSSPVSSSRSSSESGSPRASVLQEEEETTLAEALEESFSFDTPKPDSDEALEKSFSFDTLKPNSTHEAYVYAAAGLDNYSLYRKRNRGTLSTALVA